jgi:hypothetical protein
VYRILGPTERTEEEQMAPVTENPPVEEPKLSILRIEHAVSDFNAWKVAFDGDPIGRQKSGVRRYRVLQTIEDPNYVMVDLEFDSSNQAEAVLASLREMWRRVESQGLIASPRARIVEAVESQEYSRAVAG